MSGRWTLWLKRNLKKNFHFLRPREARGQRALAGHTSCGNSNRGHYKLTTFKCQPDCGEVHGNMTNWQKIWAVQGQIFSRFVCFTTWNQMSFCFASFSILPLRGITEREGLTSWDKDSWIYYDYYNILNYRSSSSNGFSLNNKSMLIPALSLSNPSITITIFLHASVNFEKNI